jgi:hypothetical protein
MRGDFVIVRAFGNIPLIRRLWDEDNHYIYITNDEQFQLLTNNYEALEPIGFPTEDVFKYDQELAESMEDMVREGKWNWDALVPWR